MSRELIPVPVVLQFQNVAANSGINITFETPGVRWSLGRRLGDSMGFSYNVTSDAGGAGAPILRAVSFNDSVLELRTSAVAPALNNFTFTLFVEVEEGTTSVQGYCTINNEATVLASFGDGLAAMWRNGRISAGFRHDALRYHAVLLNIRGLGPGRQLNIVVDSDQRSDVCWALGPYRQGTSGLTLRSPASGPVQLASWAMTPREIRLRTGDGAGSTSTNLALHTYVACAERSDSRRVYLKTVGDTDIAVVAQIGTRQPQWVGSAYTLFTL
jgi:hypothetical protein